MERVGFHVRAAAFLIDLLVFAVVAHVAIAIEWNLYESGTWHLFGVITSGAAWTTLAVLGVLEALVGTSPGKRLIGISIAADDGRTPPRRAMMIRAAFKFAPVVLALGGMWAFAVQSQWGSYGDVHDGFAALFWTDAVVTAAVSVFVIVGCFRALKADHQAFHDLAAGTAVFATRELVRARGFVPLLASATSAGTAQPPVPALSISSQGPDAGAPLTR
jgi:uncharacterized RDD family membrane protein YckC